MSSLLRVLREFNRKERFFLIGMALGNENFSLSDAFREALGGVLEVEVPKDAFVAMDYHLDWLAASLQLASHSDTPGPHRRFPAIFTATQEDVDLLVAYEDKTATHIILIEAKGVTAYSNKQFRSKVKRLRAIFCSKDAAASRADPYLVLISPRYPRNLNLDKCSPWMLRPDGKVAWLPLKLPSMLRKVVRCRQDGSVSQQGHYWKAAMEKVTG